VPCSCARGPRCHGILANVKEGNRHEKTQLPARSDLRNYFRHRLGARLFKLHSCELSTERVARCRVRDRGLHYLLLDKGRGSVGAGRGAAARPLPRARRYRLVFHHPEAVATVTAPRFVHWSISGTVITTRLPMRLRCLSLRASTRKWAVPRTVMMRASRSQGCDAARRIDESMPAPT